MSKASEAELAALKEERRDLTAQIVRMTQEYVNTTTPPHTRMRAVEDKLGRGWLAKGGRCASRANLPPWHNWHSTPCVSANCNCKGRADFRRRERAGFARGVQA